MGDFNDEPCNRSLQEYALSERVEKRVKSKRCSNPYFLNLMWPLMGTGVGTHHFDGLAGMLDQFLVNRPLLRSDSPLLVEKGSVEILQLPEMIATTGQNKGGPRRFGRPSKPDTFDETGFSDHFPICVVVKEQ